MYQLYQLYQLFSGSFSILFIFSKFKSLKLNLYYYLVQLVQNTKSRISSGFAVISYLVQCWYNFLATWYNWYKSYVFCTAVHKSYTRTMFHGPCFTISFLNRESVPIYALEA